MPERNVWTTYQQSEIKGEYYGTDTLVLLNRDNGQKSTIINSTFEHLAGLVVDGHNGAIFDGLHYNGLMDKKGDELANPQGFQSTLKLLEGILLKK